MGKFFDILNLTGDIIFLIETNSIGLRDILFSR